MNQALPKLEPISLPPLPDRPLFSVLIPNYNYARYVGLALESVLNQTYQNFEVVVCDDGSTDNSRQVIEEYAKKDPRIKLVAQENCGFTSAVNTAYENCKGEIIALLDADDAFKPSKLEKVLEAFGQHPRSALCVHRVLPVSATGQPLGRPYPEHIDYGWIGPEKLREGGCSDLPTTSGLSFRRELASQLFPIPVEIKRFVDYYLSRTGQFLTELCLAPGALTEYRLHGASMSGLSGAAAQSSLVSTDVHVHLRTVDDLECVVPLQREFLTRRYGPEIGETLRLEDHRGYWIILLSICALRGKRSGRIRPYSIKQMIQHIPRPAERRLWRAIMLLPDPLAKRAYCFWMNPSRLKRVVKAVVLPWIRR